MREKDRAWIEVDQKSLLSNAAKLQRLAGPQTALMPAVKANAYGHGDVLISGILQEAGIRNFCVASAEEAVRLRKAGISGQILILGYTHPEEFPALAQWDLTQTAVDPEYARRLSDFAVKQGRRGKKYREEKDSGQGDGTGGISVHIGVDTGMHRLGIPFERPDLIEKVRKLPGLKVTGVYSHLCVSDGRTPAEEEYTREQIRRFETVTEYLRRDGKRNILSHIQGSYGLLNYPEYAFDLARPGIALYGCLSSGTDCVKTGVTPDPVLSLKARIASVKELPFGECAGYGLTYTAESTRKTAIVSIGYADGIPRCLSNRGYALVRGRKVPIIGRICMDMLTLDVTDVPGVHAGDEAVFIGRSGKKENGEKEDLITAESVAEAAGTITNELLSRLGARLDRIAV